MLELKDIPANLQTDFLIETESDTPPAIRREGNTVIYPAFIRIFEREGEGGTISGYRYFEIPVPYTGQNLDDEATFLRQSYAAIRKFLYGSPEVQNEQMLKGTFTAHQYAVRAAFPKKAGEVPENIAEFEKIKAEFWAIIDAVAEQLGLTRDDFPKGGTSADIVAFCLEHGMTQEQIGPYAIQILGIVADLGRFGRNWNELF